MVLMVTAPQPLPAGVERAMKGAPLADGHADGNAPRLLHARRVAADEEVDVRLGLLRARRRGDVRRLEARLFRLGIHRVLAPEVGLLELQRRRGIEADLERRLRMDM